MEQEVLTKAVRLSKLTRDACIGGIIVSNLTLASAADALFEEHTRSSLSPFFQRKKEISSLDDSRWQGTGVQSRDRRHYHDSPRSGRPDFFREYQRRAGPSAW
jgi:hypothetical protein